MALPTLTMEELVAKRDAHVAKVEVYNARVEAHYAQGFVARIRLGRQPWAKLRDEGAALKLEWAALDAEYDAWQAAKNTEYDARHDAFVEELKASLDIRD